MPRENSKHQGGTVGKLTQGVIDRTAYYEHTAILALIPFINPQLYAAS
jgi:inosine/xanthosine triphosphatase